MRNYSTLFFLLGLLILSCEQEKESSAITVLSSPAQIKSGEPNLFTTADGEVYMSWIQKSDNKSQLYYSQLVNNEWQEPVMISEGDDWFVNWADFPSFIKGDGFMAAHWLQKRAAGTYDYDIHMSTSSDGKTWSESFIPHKDGVSAEHGFVSMLPTGKDEYFATWLDGRNTKVDHDNHESMHGGAMSIRAGYFTTQGETVQEWELDSRTCDCCQTAAAMTTEGPIVIYRGRSDNEIRDIFYTRLVDGNWTTPSPVANDFWEIAGCPVNGPSVAVNGNTVATIWYTASGSTPKVRMAISNNNGEAFGQPIEIAQGNTIGRVGISPLGNDSFVASYVETAAETAYIRLAKFDLKGMKLGEITLDSTSLQRSSGFPVITETGEGLVAAWTCSNEEPIIKTASVQF